MALSLAPDVVVLDLVMPELDGLGAAHQISQALPDTPIILHTLDVLPELELEAKKHGVSFVVSKASSTRILLFLEDLKSRVVSPEPLPQTAQPITTLIPAVPATTASAAAMTTPDTDSSSVKKAS
jgi:DNA-binding NarL/FixJ family response regulator